jgi:hypothetical protein
VKILSHRIRHRAIIETDAFDLKDGDDVMALAMMTAVEITGDPHAGMDITNATAKRIMNGIYEVLWEEEAEATDE